MEIGNGFKNILLTLPLMAGIAALTAGPGEQAVAAGSTCGTIGNYFDAAQSANYSSSVYGVRADIERQVPALCSASGGSPSISTVWAMLVPATPTTQYAQAGYINVGANNAAFPGHPGMHTFSQFTTAAGPPVTAWGSDPSGTTTYKVFYRPSDNRVHMLANNTEIDVMGRDVIGEWSSDWAGQFAGETHHKQSDVPGSMGNHVTFDQIKKYDVSLLTSPITNLNLYTPTWGNYKHSLPGTASYDVWTVDQ